MKLTNWLFHPFDRLAGFKALVLGLVFLALSVALVTWFKARYDGVLNLHFFETVSWSAVALDQILNALCLLVFLGGSNYLLSNRKPRLINLSGTLILAMAPMTLLPLQNANGALSDLSATVAQDPTAALNVLQLISPAQLIFSTIFSLALLAYHVYLLFKAYQICGDFKGPKLGLSFALALLLAFTASLFTQHQLLPL